MVSCVERATVSAAETQCRRRRRPSQAPLMLGVALYTLKFERHRGWYSWGVSSATGGVEARTMESVLESHASREYVGTRHRPNRTGLETYRRYESETKRGLSLGVGRRRRLLLRLPHDGAASLHQLPPPVGQKTCEPSFGETQRTTRGLSRGRSCFWCFFLSGVCVCDACVAIC